MRYLLLLSVLLLGAALAAAQDYPNQGDQTKSSSSGTEMTVQGCLSSSGGTYTLTDMKGNSFQLVGDTAKLSEHVGHEIKVTGMSSSTSPSPSGGNSSGTMGQASNSSQQALEVSSVKHISKNCKNSGTSH